MAEPIFLPRGWTSEVYEGHYFGILKCICCLFYLHQSRHCESIAYLSSNCFTASAKRAQELSQDGALFAWRTIDGQETSAYYPAGTAQLHINADIVYAFSTL